MKVKEKQYKYSSQRNQILDILSRSRVHLTANMIYEEMKNQIPNISMGTVYRNLSVLAEQGLVNKLDLGKASDRFEFKREPHYHFVCETCGKVIDVDIPNGTSILSKVENEYNVKINHHEMVFYGTCGDCENFNK